VKLARRISKPPITQSDLAARLQVQGLNFDRVNMASLACKAIETQEPSFGYAIGLSLNWREGRMGVTMTRKGEYLTKVKELSLAGF
jgi:hypothetical protein